MFTIGKLANASEVSPDTIRFYEREGLLTPAGRTAGSYRYYDPDSVRRLRFIRHAQSCGFALTEIKELLAVRGRDTACCRDVRKQAIEKKLQLEAKLRALKAMSQALDRLIDDCTTDDRPATECPILAAFDQAFAPGPPK